MSCIIILNRRVEKRDYMQLDTYLWIRIVLTSFVNNKISLQGPRAGPDEMQKWTFLTLSELVPVESIIFTSPYRPDPLWSPPSLLSSGYRGSFHGVYRAGRETDHSLSTTAEVNKIWIYASTLRYVFLA
jgi:hypothetical protein